MRVLVHWQPPFVDGIVATTLISAVWLLVGCGEVANAPGTATSVSKSIVERRPFCLTTEFLPLPNADSEGAESLLVRELGRQAILIAARDGLGLSTRDESLAESFPAAGDRLGPFALEFRASNEGIASMRLQPAAERDESRETTAAAPPIEFSFQPDSYNKYTSLAIALGGASRGELVATLKNAGLSGQEVRFEENGPLPDGAEDLLEQMNFVAQYAAIRRIHGEMAAQGESPQRLGGLVRGYANLAMLVRHHWTSAESVFAARSMLYAERMILHNGKTPFTIQHRAYARAMIGLHGIALQDLHGLPGDGDGTNVATTPAWAMVIEPFCSFDQATLMDLADEPGLRQLVNLLAFQMKSCYLNERWNIAAGELAANQCPESYGVYTEMANASPMLAQRQAVQRAAESLGRRLPKSLVRIKGLPNAVLEIVREELQPKESMIAEAVRGNVKTRAWSPRPMQIADALRTTVVEAGDAHEPSWQVLAGLISEEQFIAAANYLRVSMNAVEYSKKELVEQLAPLVKGHRYAPFLRSYAFNKQQQPEEMTRLAGQIRVVDPRCNMYPMINLFFDEKDAGGRPFSDYSTEALWQHDYCLPAIISSLRCVDDSWWQIPDLLPHFQRYIVDLKWISPQAPNTLRLEIDTTVNPTTEQLAEWEERAKRDPLALFKIAKLLEASGNSESAIQCYENTYELCPSYDTAIAIATAYRASGQEDKWLPALERYLQEDDYSLGHASIHQHIAKDYMEKGRWSAAEPHALAAAQTWSAWGLNLASQVCEGLGKWQESERWIREETVKYPTSSGMNWYLWCRRTGRGDRQHARQYAVDFLPLPWLALPESDVYYPFLNDMFEGRYEDALARIGRSPRCTSDSCWQFQAAALAKQLGRDELYEQSMKNAMELADQQLLKTEPQLHAFVAILFAGRNGPAFTEAQLADADKLLEGFSLAERCNCAYLLGEMLALHGDQNRAERYWRMALETGQFDNRHATLAGWRLAEMHGTSRSDNAIDAAGEANDVDADENPADNSL